MRKYYHPSTHKKILTWLFPTLQSPEQLHRHLFLTHLNLVNLAFSTHHNFKASEQFQIKSHLPHSQVMSHKAHNSFCPVAKFTQMTLFHNITKIILVLISFRWCNQMGFCVLNLIIRYRFN